MKSNLILLVEDDPHDETLTIRELQRQSVTNRIDVVRDGAGLKR